MLSSRLGAVLALLTLFWGGAAAAQPLGPEAGKGAIRGFVFRPNGLPVTGVEVRVFGGDVIATTNAEGMFTAELEPGDYDLEFAVSGRPKLQTTSPIPVLEGQETEFLLTLPDDGQPIFDIEAPADAIESSTEVEGTTGFVEGTISSAEDGKPIENARVFVRGTPIDARTDAEGAFRLELPTGTREITIIHPNFSTTTLGDIVVTEGETTTVDPQMEKKTFQLAEIVITAPRIEGSAIQVLQQRQDSASVADVLGADQISKAGDSDAASALARVTGVTIVGGQFVYVRGLGERYSQTLLNGSSLPSPDPERRVVPLDLFPASTISALTVQKTFSPDIPGEFGGGIVQIQTRDIPEEFEASIGISGKWTFGTTLEQGLDYDGSGTDFLGFGTGARALPERFARVAEEQPIRIGTIIQDGLSPAELEELGESLDQTWDGTPADIPPGIGLSGSVGGKFDFFGARSGALVAVDYSSDYFLKKSEFNTFSINQDGIIAPRKELRIQDTQWDVGLTGLASWGIDFNDKNNFRLTVGVFRSSIDRVQDTTGFDDDRGTDVNINLLRWSERMVNTNQIRGTNVLSSKLGLKLDWRYQFAVATRDEPNRRVVRYTLRNDVFVQDNDGNERYYSDLLDMNHEGGVDFSLPVRLIGEVESTLSAGFAFDIRNRDVSTRRYFFERGGASQESRLPPNRVFRDDTIAPNLFQLIETTRSDDTYVGEQTLLAGYLMGNIGILDNLTVLAGARVESSVQTIRIEPPFAPPGADTQETTLDRFDVMPAVTATWEFIPNMQLRLAGGITVNRPNFRELSPAAFIDFARAQESRGNPDLDRAQLYHGDIRWEWYPSPGESFSVAGFVKIIHEPIEYTLQGGANQIRTPVNTEQAENFGAEFEMRKNFGFISGFFEDMYVAGNLTLVSSSIIIGDENAGILTSTERALQNQSPYAVNAQLGYDNVDLGFSGTILFNVFGRRIADVGAFGVPDVYEEPRPTLDVVLKQRVDRFKFGLKFQNILNPDTRFTQTEPGGEGRIFNREIWSRGLRVSASLSVDLD